MASTKRARLTAEAVRAEARTRINAKMRDAGRSDLSDEDFDKIGEASVSAVTNARRSNEVFGGLVDALLEAEALIDAEASGEYADVLLRLFQRGFYGGLGLGRVPDRYAFPTGAVLRSIMEGSISSLPAAQSLIPETPFQAPPGQVASPPPLLPAVSAERLPIGDWTPRRHLTVTWQQRGVPWKEGSPSSRDLALLSLATMGWVKPGESFAKVREREMDRIEKDHKRLAGKDDTYASERARRRATPAAALEIAARDAAPDVAGLRVRAEARQEINKKMRKIGRKELSDAVFEQLAEVARAAVGKTTPHAQRVVSSLADALREAHALMESGQAGDREELLFQLFRRGGYRHGAFTRDITDDTVHEIMQVGTNPTYGDIGNWEAHRYLTAIFGTRVPWQTTERKPSPRDLALLALATLDLSVKPGESFSEVVDRWKINIRNDHRRLLKTQQNPCVPRR